MGSRHVGQDFGGGATCARKLSREGWSNEGVPLIVNPLGAGEFDFGIQLHRPTQK